MSTPLAVPGAKEPARRPGERAPQVLVVDRDERSSSALESALAAAGCHVAVEHGEQGLAALLESRAFDAVLCDSETAPLEAFAQLLAEPGAPALILLAGFGSIHQAVEAMRGGAADYLTKPVSSERLELALGRCLESRNLRAENRRLRAEVGERFELGKLVSRSPAMQRVFETVRAVADTRATILIEGESGTGKTMLARSVHRHSSRPEAPFVEVNCGALPENLLESELFGHARGAFTGAVRDHAGKFEEADGGTIFLDEIACASLDLQVKLLRVLQDRVFERVGEGRTRKVDVRVICASNRDLAEEVRAGRFREDLYYRIHVVSLLLPPLRERPGDVPLLADAFLSRYAREYERGERRFHPAAVSALASHGWPGNVRELENKVERAVLLAPGEVILREDLFPQRAPAPALGPAGGPPLDALPGLRPLREALEDSERRLIVDALRHTGGCRKEAAALLDVNRTTLFNKMKKYNLMDLDFEA